MSYAKHILWVCTAALVTGWVFTNDDGRCSGTVTRQVLPTKPFAKYQILFNTGPSMVYDNDVFVRSFSMCSEIEADLTQLWPSFIKGRHFFYFWKEEWIKHGTCAGCEETMGSPLLYFQAAVKLRKLFDIDNVLESSGIKTSCDVSYKHDDIRSVLTPLLGQNYDLQCVTDSKGREAWIQLKIHLFRNQTIGCPKEEQEQKFDRLSLFQSTGHPCPKNTTIFYVPINYKNPHEPCN
ncbi:Ribonuclease T2 [Labeo rohita]|uniref:Ribonuclease T2 n=1 Tax=Labeo rohita TaxID=84645 RepID=A0ABQ8LZQ0_LABRO|nr:Ribonuclease T2 [Labeo rohita]